MTTINLSSIDMRSAINDLLHQRGTVNVVFDDGQIVSIPVRKLIFHLIFWNVGRKWRIKLTPDFIVDTTSINSSTVSELCTKILHAVYEIHSSYHAIAIDMNNAMNTLNRFVIDNCQEYHRSLSILDLAHIAMIPEIKQITDKKISDISMPMREAEKAIKTNVNALFDQLKKPYPGNTIRDFINLRFVSATQLAHIFYQIGFRTDINDTIIRYPIQGNYLDGLRNSIEYCLETLSAKKSTFYNRDSLPIAEYFGRKQHILLSSIRHLYPGDCGTNVTMSLLISEKMRDVVLYKNIVEDAKIITLTPKNINNYVGKVVKFRTPMACRHRDGICEACGGKLLSSLTPNTHLGMFSAIQTTSVITQVILSAKHLQDTATVEYIIPADLNTILIKNQGAIYVKPKISDKFKEAVLIFSINDAKHLLGLSDFNIDRLNAVNETSFGVCREIVILKGQTPMTDQVSLNVNGQYPLYSKHLIKYIAEHPEHVVIRDDMFQLKMRDFDFKFPIFKLIVFNRSMVRFVNEAKKLLENDIRNYTSATELVNDFTNLVYDQVKPNLAYLEVVLRAAMVNSKNDYRLPIVEDIDNVMFTTNHAANMMRSLGMLCAFQQLPSSFKDPSMYLIPRTFTPFDEFLNLKARGTR